MQVTDFYKLKRAVQERFLGSVAGRSPPLPILAVRTTTGEHVVWLAISVVASAILLGVYRMAMGDLASAMSVQPGGMVVVYIVLVGVVALGVVRALALWRETKRLPFKPGIYVFPRNVIDARRYKLRVFPMSELAGVEGPDAGGIFKLNFPGQTFQFAVGDPERVAAASKALSDARANLSSLPDDPKLLSAIDPLLDSGFASPLIPTVALQRRVPPWAQFFWGVAAAIGLIVGPVVWLLRNVSSDERMYARAVAAGDVDSFKAYLAHGSRYDAEVSGTFLPRAELALALKDGSVEAMETYIAAHPGSQIQGEVDVALRKAMLAELERAKQPGTLTSLNDFVKKHPKHGLAREVAAAKHAVYAAALDAYKDDAPTQDASLLPFMEHLLAFAEKNGPQVQIRFRRRSSRSLERADSVIAKNASFMGTLSYVTHYFDDKHARTNEADLGKAIAARFAAAFPEDLLTFEVADAVADPDGPLPAPTVPTLFIEHNTEWSGGTQTTKVPRGVYAGIGLFIDASFRIPDDSKPRTFKQTIWRNPNLNDLAPEDRPEEKVYAAAQVSCFEEFGKKFLAIYFKPQKK
jgi:hypothetical protein